MTLVLVPQNLVEDRSNTEDAAKFVSMINCLYKEVYISAFVRHLFRFKVFI